MKGMKDQKEGMMDRRAELMKFIWGKGGGKEQD
jgi:hypothetical protein